MLSTDLFCWARSRAIWNVETMGSRWTRSRDVSVMGNYCSR